MVSSVSTDINLPLSSHLLELLNIIKFHLVFFILFSFTWSFFVEDLISRWLSNIPLENEIIYVINLSAKIYINSNRLRTQDFEMSEVLDNVYVIK